jgi:hypothetical protein
MVLNDMSTAYAEYRTNIKDTLDLSLGDLETFLGDEN